MNNISRDDKYFFALGSATIAALSAAFAAYVTHLWWIITLLMSGAAVPANHVIIAVLGAFLPPIGMLHGFWLWFH